MATIAITTQRGRLGSVSETSPQGEDGHVPAGIADGRPQSPDTPTAIPLQEQQSAKQPSAPPHLKPTQQTPRAIASALQRMQHNSSGRGVAISLQEREARLRELEKEPPASGVRVRVPFG